MKILVTGGGGFLGQILCRRLVERGHEVVSFNRSAHDTLTEIGVRQVQGELGDREAVLGAAEDAEAVFHTAAKSVGWGDYPSYHRANVEGTNHVIEACRKYGTTRLVYTSTPSVTHRAGRPVEGGTAESVPYGTEFKAPYAETKKIAEEAVIAADDDTLATVSLRPRLMWGPGDNQLLPRMVERANANRLRIVGDGTNLVDSTYIENAVQAHLDAFDAVSVGAPCAGKAYFISNGEPLGMGELLNSLLRAAGAKEVDRTLPFWAAYSIAASCEFLWARGIFSGEPPLTRFLVEQLATTHWYDMAPATADLGYRPSVSVAEGMDRLQAAYQG